MQIPKMVILGGGAIVSECHLPAIEKLGNMRSLTVVEPLKQNVERLRTLYKDLDVRAIDYREFFSDPKTPTEGYEAALIALPHKEHDEAIERSIQAGLHVLCEKPLTLNPENCKKFDQLARDKNRILSVGMVRRYLPAVQAALKVARSGVTGQLRSVSISFGTVFNWPLASRSSFTKEHGGVLAGMGIHFLDLAQLFTGRLEPESYTDDYRGGAEANCEYRLKSDDGVPVTIRLSLTHGLKSRICLSYEKGDLVVEQNKDDVCYWISKVDHYQAEIRIDRPFRSGIWPQNFLSCFIEQFYDFFESIYSDEPTRVTAEDAYPATRLIEWAYQHHKDRPADVLDGRRPSLEPSAVLITGGTGFVGSHLVERLFDIGFSEVRAAVRSFIYPNLGRFPAKIAWMDVLDRQAVREAVRGCRYVFHLAYGKDSNDMRYSERVTIQGTKNVVEESIQAGVECVVVVSTASVFGVPVSGIRVDEHCGYVPHAKGYADHKIRMERYCLERAKTSGKTRLVVLNPGAVYGPGNSMYTLSAPLLAREGAFCWIDDGQGTASYVYVDNLVDAILLSVSKAAAHGERFIISDGICSWKELIWPLIESLNISIPSLTAQELYEKDLASRRVRIRDLIKILLNNREFLDRVSRDPILGRIKVSLSRKAPAFRNYVHSSSDLVANAQTIPPAWIGQVYGSSKIQLVSDKARLKLSWKPVVSLQEGQDRCVQWLKETEVI